MKSLFIFFKALFKTTLRFVLVIVLLPVVLIAVFLAGAWGYQFYSDYKARLTDGPQWREKQIERRPYLAYENAADFSDIIDEAAESGSYHGVPLEIESETLLADIVVALEFMRNETPSYFRSVKRHTKAIVESHETPYPRAQGGITYMPVNPPPVFGIMRPDGTASVLIHENVHHTQSADIDVDEMEREAYRKQVEFLREVNADPIITRKFEWAAENWTEEKLSEPWSFKAFLEAD